MGFSVFNILLVVGFEYIVDPQPYKFQNYSFQQVTTGTLWSRFKPWNTAGWLNVLKNLWVQWLHVQWHLKCSDEELIALFQKLKQLIRGHVQGTKVITFLAVSLAIWACFFRLEKTRTRWPQQLRQTYITINTLHPHITSQAIVVRFTTVTARGSTSFITNRKFLYAVSGLYASCLWLWDHARK